MGVGGSKADSDNDENPEWQSSSKRKNNPKKKKKHGSSKDQNSDSERLSDVTPNTSPRDTVAAPAGNQSKSEHKYANSATCLKECSKIVTAMKKQMDAARKYHNDLYVSMVEVQCKIAQNHMNIQTYHDTFVSELQQIELILKDTSEFATQVHMGADSESSGMEEKLDEASNDDEDVEKHLGKSDEDDNLSEIPPGRSHGKDDHTKAESKEQKKKEHSQSPRRKDE